MWWRAMELLLDPVHQESPRGSSILAQGKTASAAAAQGQGRSLNGRLKVCFIGGLLDLHEIITRPDECKRIIEVVS